MDNRGKLGRIASLGLLFVFSLAIAELLLNLACMGSSRVRWALASPWERTEFVQDPVLKFKGNPDHPEHDQSGFRNSHVPDQVDLVAIGDSQTYGIGVGREETWPQQLAAAGNKSVYNLGMSGWGPIQYLAHIEQATSLSPRVVSVGLYLGNDIYDAYNLSYRWGTGSALKDPGLSRMLNELETVQPLLIQPPASERVQNEGVKAEVSLTSELRAFLSSRSKLYAFARGLWHLAFGYEVGYTQWTTEFNDDYWQRSRQLAASSPDQMIAFEAEGVRTILTPHYRKVAVNVNDPRIAEGVEVTLRALQVMHKHCEDEGVRLLVVILPTKERVFAPFLTARQYDPKVIQLSRRNTELEDIIRKRIFEVLDAEKIGYVDALPFLQQAVTNNASNPFFESLNGHYSVSGQRVIGRSVASHHLIQDSDF